MPLLVRNIPLGLGEPEEVLLQGAARRLRVPVDAIASHVPVRRSLDARDENNIHFVYHLELSLVGGVKEEKSLLRRHRLPQVSVVKETNGSEPAPGAEAMVHRPVVIGFGPAGMFAALKLAVAGYRPVVYERGRDVKRRHRDVLKRFYRDGVFDPTSNLLFGEGGAGTYSDGKLYTRVSDPLVRWVLEVFHEHGADPSVLLDAKPHIGSDKLPGICRRIRMHIEELGGEICFESALTELRMEDGVLTAVRINDGWVPVGVVVLAIGHSARDTYRMLAGGGVTLASKPFQLGVRIEHPQEKVNTWQYGGRADDSRLPPAEYQVVAKSAAGEMGDLFSFCMCPGGIILPSNESANLVATNGASSSRRGGPFANAGLVITVPPELVGDDPLAGLAFQQRWEQAAFAMTGGSYQVPAQRASDFLNERTSDGKLETSYPLGAQWGEIRRIIPGEATAALERGLRMLDKRLPGFAGDDGIIVGPETRASAPVRIVRDRESRVSTSTAGLYPVGEGAGYAGGIVSSAIDGIKTAHAVIERYAPVR